VDVKLEFTPPHSQCSIHFGKGLTAAEPGSVDRLILALPGLESQEGRSYFAYASFSDPDGNGWLLQEITTRLPGREWD
jgi:hypothetical protein